jgi:3-oxoacyl-[acyl-carrier-protein] synthase-3
MRATIRGLGEWLPPKVRTNDEWPEDVRDLALKAAGRELVVMGSIDLATADASDRAYVRRGLAEEGDPFRGTVRRRVADDAMPSSEAEALAGKAALDDAGLAPADVDVLLSWSLVPDRLSPSNAPKVADLLGARNAGALGIEAACASTASQVMLAAALVESGRARHVLLTQSHLIARANPMAHPASPMLGDAATAMVISAGERAGILATHVASDGSWHDAVTWVRGRGDDDTPWWKSGEDFVPGTRDRKMTQRLALDAVRIGVRTIGELMEKARRPVGDIDLIASSQVRAWFPACVAEALGLPEGTAPDTFKELAHVGACGVVNNLLEARRRGQLRPGARVVLYAMGAGITRAAALVEWV